MATVTFKLTATPTFSPGSTVGIYLRSAFPGNGPSTGVVPPTAALEQSVLIPAANAPVEVSGLEPSTQYVAGALVSGVWRYVGFRTDEAIPEGGGGGGGGGLTAEQVRAIAAEEAGKSVALQGRSQVPVGAAVNYEGVVNLAYGAQYRAMLRRLFSSFVCETETKQDVAYNSNGRKPPTHIDFTKAKGIAAALPGMLMRAHTPIWHNELGEWVTNPEAAWTEGTLEAQLLLYVERYAAALRDELPQCTRCDIFNELVSEKNTEKLREPGLGTGVETQSLYGHFFGNSDVIGVGNAYIKLLARLAIRFHEVAPHIDLYYSENSIEKQSNYESGSKKGLGALQICEALLAAGAPIVGISFECHKQTTFFPTVEEFRGVIRRFKALNGGTFRFAIGEVDVKVEGADTLEKAAEAYREMILAAVLEGADYIDSWSPFDAHNWLGASTESTGPRPGYLDVNWKPKPAELWLQYARRARPQTPDVPSRTITGSQTVGALGVNEQVFADPTIAELTATVPAAAAKEGQAITITNIATNGNAVKVKAADGGEIVVSGKAGAATLVLSTGESLISATLFSKGGKWYVI